MIGDDHGWPYYGFQESLFTLSNQQPVQDVVRTPNLDRLAETGVLFPRGYATDSLCLPSLQTLLSAHGHEWRQWLHMRDEVRERVPLDEKAQGQRLENRHLYSLPRAFRRAGYRTWEGGKVWGGTYRDAGFDAGTADEVGRKPLYKPSGALFGREGWAIDSCGSTARPDTTCAALAPFRQFLDDRGDAPFFAWFAPQLPHVPYDAPAAYRDELTAAGLTPDEVDHLANIRWFDELLGELLEELDRRDLRRDTLLVYLSDNGWGMGLQNRARQGRGKGTLYDIGFRSPVIFHQPGTVPGGVVLDDFVSFRDVPVTLLDHAGVGVPADADGKSLRSRIHGGPPLDRDGLVVFSHVFGGAWVDREWRYLQFDDGHEELYRISVDPIELTDVAARHPDRVAAFRARVDARRAELDTLPRRRDILVRLEDALQRPVAGGTLRLQDAAGTPLRTAVSDEDGWLSFPAVAQGTPLRLHAGRGIADISSPAAIRDGVVEPFAEPGLFTRLRVRRDRPVRGPFSGRLTGRVSAPDGAGIANARVRLLAHLPGRNLSLTTRTAADGSFAFENLVPSSRYSLITRARGHRTRRVSGIAVDAGHTRSAPLHLRSKGSLEPR